jgi:UDP-N-acetylglucosamine 3-dehydrogenase
MYKTAVVGAGVMGQNHARVLSEVSQLMGICDVNETAGKAVAKRFGVPYFKACQDVIRAGVDAVVVATPTVTHKNIAIQLIEAGKHVLVEKPLSNNVADARDIVGLAEQRGVVMAVGHIERHNPAVRYAQTAAQRGQFGKVITASAKRVSSYPGRISDVGVVIDLAIHDLDIIRYVTGSDVEAVFAAGGIQASGKHEDHADIMVMLSNGATGLVEVNWLTPMKIRKLALTCSLRYVEIDYVNQTVDISSSTAMDVDTADLSQIPQEHDHRHITLKKQEPLKNELLDFLEAIEKKKKPLVTGDDGVEAVKIARAALESIKTRKVVEMAGFEG